MRGRCPRPLDEWAGKGRVANGGRARRRTRARGCRAGPRSRGGSPRRSRARSRSGRGAAGASRSARCRRGRRGSGRTPRPRRGAGAGRASAVPTRRRTPTRRHAEKKPPTPAWVRSLRRKPRAATRPPSDSSTGSSRGRRGRSTDAPRAPARARSTRARRVVARSTPSGRARGTDRSGRWSSGATRTRRRRSPAPRSGRRRHGWHPRRRLREPSRLQPCIAPLDQAPVVGDLAPHRREPPLRLLERARADRPLAVELRSSRLFSKKRTVPRSRRAHVELLLELASERDRTLRALRSPADAPSLVAARACVRARARTGQRVGLSGSYLLDGDRGAASPRGAARVSRIRRR